MRNIFIAAGFVLCLGTAMAQNQAPRLNNIKVTNDDVNNKLTIQYELSDVENDSIGVLLKISDDGGESFLFNGGSQTGDLGYPVTPGVSKSIIWEYPADTKLGELRMRLVAYDNHRPDLSELVAKVNIDSLRKNMKDIEGIRNYLKQPNKIAEVKDIIDHQFINGGLFSKRQGFKYVNQDFENLTGRKHGIIDESQTYIIDAHFDTANDAPGADDNGSGVLGVLEALRILKDYHFEKNILFASFDLEEAGLVGSGRYVQSGINAWEKIQGVLNFEMIGFYSNQPNSQQLPTGFELVFPDAVAKISADEYRGNFIVNVGNDASKNLMNTFESVATQYVPALKVISLQTPGKGSLTPDLRRSDHARFWDGNINALMLTDGSNFRNPNYHLASDTSGTLNFEFIANVTAASLATLAQLAVPVNARIEEVDLSAYVGTHEHNVSFPYKVKIYPNPADTRLKIRLEGEAQELITISIFDVAGKSVFSKKVYSDKISDLNINTSSFPQGSYFVILQAGESTHTAKIALKH